MRTKGVCALILMSVLLVVMPGMSAAGAATPDLVVTTVAVKQAEAAVGEALRVVVTVKNAGGADAAASKTALYLSSDKKLDRGDTRLAERASVARLSKGERARSVVKGAVPAGVKVGTYRLLACADATKVVRETNEKNNCAPTGAQLQVVTRTSEDKIDEAEASGAIDAETALRYRIFAMFNDSRLPAAYRGDDSQALESEALQTARDSWSDLSAATQKLVNPYLTPPFYQGSAWSPIEKQVSPGTRLRADEGGAPGCNYDQISEDWKSVLSEDGKVRVWWQMKYDDADGLRARQILQTIEDKIWPALKGLMGREPLLDSAGMCDGPDSALDLALVDADTDTTIRKDFFGCQSPTYILLKRTRPGSLPFVAHELMHSLQYSYDVSGSCDDYKWLREATAQWFMDYVSDAGYGHGVTPDDSEWLHGAPELYLDRPEVALESTSPLHHEYGSYLWFFFMARFDTPNYVKAVWDGTTAMSSLDAVTTPLGGNFDATWREFVKTNWNRGDIDDYRTWDGLTAKAGVEADFKLTKGKASATISVNHLGAKYYTFHPDPSLTSLEFDNESVGVPGAGVQAIITYANGTEKVEDWSDKAHVELCLKLPEVKEITLVFSNSNIDKGNKVDFDITWTGQQGICCTGTPAPQRTGQPSTDTAGATAEGSGCPAMTGTITYTETDSWNAPPGGCCTGSDTLKVQYGVLMAPEPDGFGWVDDGSTYDITYTGQQSGHGDFGIANCDYQDNYHGAGAGPVKAFAGKIVEEGDLSPVSGKPAEGRELLLFLSDWDMKYIVSGTQVYSGCDNDSHNATIEDGPDEKDVDPPLGECDGMEGALWLRGAADARTLTATCTITDENGVTRTTTASVTF